MVPVLCRRLGLFLSCWIPVALPAQDDGGDLWDHQQGIQVTDSSALKTDQGFQFDVRDMFGGQFSTWANRDCVDTGNVIFADFQPAGTLHWVEWRTPKPVTVRSMHLEAAHDWVAGEDRPALVQRAFAGFKLYAWDSGQAQWILLLHYLPTIPFAPNDPKWVNTLNLKSNLPPVPSTRFRAEFLQDDEAGNTPYRGPRIIELNGFPDPLPVAGGQV